MGFNLVKVKHRKAPVARDQLIWVDRTGAAAYQADKNGAGGTRRFRNWLVQAAKKQAIGLRSGLNGDWYKQNGVTPARYRFPPIF
jgi:hypothetical protein